MNTPTAFVLIAGFLCVTFLVVFMLNTVNIHTLPKERLKPYQESLEVIHKGMPETKLDIKMEIDMK